MAIYRPLFRLFSFFFKQTLQFLQQYNVKNVYPVSDHGIRTSQISYAFFVQTKYRQSSVDSSAALGSSPKHSIYAFIIYSQFCTTFTNLSSENNENKQKRPGLAHFLKKTIRDINVTKLD